MYSECFRISCEIQTLFSSLHPSFFFQHVTCRGHHPFLIIGLLVEDAEAIIKFMTQSPCWVLYWVFPSNNISNQGGKNLLEMVGDHYLRAFQGTVIFKNNIVFQNSLLDLTFLTANWYCFFKMVASFVINMESLSKLQRSLVLGHFC